MRLADLPAFVIEPRYRKPSGHAGVCVVCRGFTNEQFIFDTCGEMLDAPACLTHSKEEVLDELYWNLAQNLRRQRHG